MAQPPAGPGSDDQPIFVVGLPRSGTTLLAAMLTRHPAIDCGPETFFFARLPDDPSMLARPRGWPRAAVEYVCGLRLRDAPVHELFGRTRRDIEAFLAVRDPSLAAALESLTAARAAARGKRRWAEKTPRHLGRLPLIRRTYPRAAVIRVVRDPRDAAMSMTRVPFASDSLITDLYLVARADAAAAPFLRQDARSLSVRYEDLVTAPEREARRVAAFLGEAYDPRMLEPEGGLHELAADHEWWKGKEAQPLDPSRVEAWRREMSPEDQRIASVVCAAMIRRHGYEGAVSPRGAVMVAPDGVAFVARQEGAARALALRGVIVRSLEGRSAARDRVPLAFWPLPEPDRWALGVAPRARLRALVRMGLILARRRLAGDPAVVVRPADHERLERRPPATRLAELLLRVLARRSSPEAWLAGVSPPLPETELR